MFGYGCGDHTVWWGSVSNLRDCAILLVTYLMDRMTWQYLLFQSPDEIPSPT